MTKYQKRWVYGTKTGRWTLVGPNDRDYNAAIPIETMKKIGKVKAKELYLSATFISRENPAKVEVYDNENIIKGNRVEIIPGHRQFYLYDEALQINIAKSMSYSALEKFAKNNGLVLIDPMIAYRAYSAKSNPGGTKPTKEMKKQYIEMIIQHSAIPGYRRKLDNKIINQYGYDFWEELVYKTEGYPTKSNPAKGVMDKIAEYLIKRKLPPTDTNVKTAYQVVTNDFPTMNQIADIQDYLETGRVEKRNPDGFTITKDELHKFWASSKPITVDDKKYSVHLMSYGDYFLEPFGKEYGETEGFHPATLWLQKIDKNLYAIEGEVMKTKHNPKGKTWRYYWKIAAKSPVGTETMLPDGRSFITYERGVFLRYGEKGDGLIAVTSSGEFYGRDYKIANVYEPIKDWKLVSRNPHIKRNPFFLPLLAAIPWWGWLVGAGVAGYGVSKIFGFKIPIVGEVLDTVRGVGKSIPFLVGATAVGVAGKYLISPEKKGLKLSADIATYSLLGIGIYQMVGTGSGLFAYYKNKQIPAPASAEVKTT